MSLKPPVRHPDAVHVDASESGHVLRRRDDGSEHLVNETALALWQLCDGATTTDEMVDGICGLFAASREAVAADIAAALEQLWHAGLVWWPDDNDGRVSPSHGAATTQEAPA